MKHLKDERGIALILELVLVAIVLLVVGFAVYTSMNSKKTSNAQAPATAKPSPSLASKTTVTPAPKTTISSSDGVASVTLPDGWKVASQTAKFSSFATGQCDLSARLSPNNFAGESQWTVTFCKTSQTPKAWSEQPIGIPSSSFVEQNQTPINGYQTYFAKISTSSYVDYNYFIESSGYIAYIYARESSKHYTPQGAVDESIDSSQYTPAFKQIVDSIKFK